jgi:hypothetical protein
MTYREALEDAQKAFLVGVHPAHIILALMSEGIPRQRAETILRWCALNAEKYRNRLDIHV